jgi:hypothetical protein
LDCADPIHDDVILSVQEGEAVPFGYHRADGRGRQHVAPCLAVETELDRVAVGQRTEATFSFSNMRRDLGGSQLRYSTARIATMIAITTAHDSAERPAMTTTACLLGKRTSASIGGPSLVRLWSTR